jgi:hypothetical protein
MITYIENRKCAHCGTPIADQSHGLRKFCPREVLSDGSIKNCKDEYWSAINREQLEPFITVAYFQKQQFENLEGLHKAKGESVVLEDINKWGVDLSRPLKFKIQENQYTWWFHHYGIKQLPNNQFKIFTHELH